MSSSKYRAFAKTAELHSITRASEQLGYTQSGVSHLIATLEKELGIPLLIREKAGTTLTSEGRVVLSCVKQILEAEENLNNTVRNLRGLHTGTLRIGTFSSVSIRWLPEILSRFKFKYPGIEISIYNADYAQIEESLSKNAVDCGFVTLPSREEFFVQPLAHDRLMAVVPANSILCQKRELQPQDLAAETFIVPAEGTKYDVGKLFNQVGISPRDQLEFCDDYAAVEMVKQDLGVTILPELMVKSLPMDKICAIPICGSSRTIGLAANRDRQFSPVVQAFFQCVKEGMHGDCTNMEICKK